MPFPEAPSSPTTLLRRGNPEGFQRLCAPLAPLCLLAASDEAVKAYGLTASAVTFQGVFSPCKSDTPPCARAHGLSIMGFYPPCPSRGEDYKKNALIK
ncbi:hypothetical protein EVAR_34140_1 [Eumeta japonica]|uniref:Uncharacterized protein n=1 Tax=Eumeta variegata TaxID=151549 RepID=A0A4C1WMK5_EUMVA|nr:hypothetical protein EVAR_34140_1 [Eumeta japonica]